MSDKTTNHILIADDDQPSLALLEILMRSLGCQVTLVTDGAEVLRQAQAVKPDLILLDLHMPHVNGFEVCAQLKGDAGLCDIPVIFITADALKKSNAQCTGCVDYITKPFDILAVKSIVQSYLR